MNNERLVNVIRAPHVSEKSSRLQESANQFVFEVASDASKADVKAAVESMFKVKVDAVRVVNVKGKRKAFRGRTGKRGTWRKAYVSLGEGQTIDLVAKA